MKHSENKILEKFLPFRMNCTEYMLGDSLDVNTIDIYCYNTCYRVMEIDTNLKSLHLTLEYLKKREFTDSSYSFITHHSFHIENFFLRLTGLIDRCYLFAGTSIGLDKNKIEKLSGKKLIIKELNKLSHPNSLTLAKLDDTINEFKKERNKIAHQESYYRKNFIILNALDNEDKEFSSKFNIDISIDKVKSHEIFLTNEMFNSLLDELDNLIKRLIDNFDDTYLKVIKKSNS